MKQCIETWAAFNLQIVHFDIGVEHLLEVPFRLKRFMRISIVCVLSANA
jgi:hypothetical protein